jgi:hypothetical protein
MAAGAANAATPADSTLRTASSIAVFLMIVPSSQMF